jgi:hypothetical protein
MLTNDEHDDMRRTARKAGGSVAVFGPSPPGMLGGGGVVGFVGPTSPGPRRTNGKAKAKARAHRKRVKRQRRHEARR